MLAPPASDVTWWTESEAKRETDLMAIGDKYPRHGLIQPVLEPSSSILPGYSTTIVKTKSGQI